MLGEAATRTVTEQLRACSREEAELQAQLLRRPASGDRGRGPGRAAARPPRRGARRSSSGSPSSSGASSGRPTEPLGAPRSASEIERKLERLARRREQLGPGQPARRARVRGGARARRASSRSSARTSSRRSPSSQGLIRETDRKIRRAPSRRPSRRPQRNFEELVEHLFPGGRGRLRLVDASAAPAWCSGRRRRRRRRSSIRPTTAGRSGREAEAFGGRGVRATPRASRSRSRRPARRRGGCRCSRAARRRWSRWPSCSPSSSPGRRPFYILDEVEAALDDANIDRFLQLVRRFSDRAQFIIVTHQKRTMDAADVLYGVSMGEGGVTKVISRRAPADDAQPTPPRKPRPPSTRRG